MSPTLRNVVLFSGGIIFPAAVILLHECGHFAAGYLSGFKMSFHYAEVRFTTPGEISDQALVVVTAAGPGVEASLAAGGFLWLRRARRARLDGHGLCPQCRPLVALFRGNAHESSANR